jgi:hypothetical protein
MTPITRLPRTAKATRKVSVEEVKQLLREAAFVLRMTRRVKADILRDAAGPSQEQPRAADCTPAALGV